MVSIRRLIVVIGMAATVRVAIGQQQENSQPFVPANRWALVIGASAYKSEIGPLRYTSKEAREFSEQLKQRLGFSPENVRLLTDGASAEEAPTSPHILEALDSLLKNPRLDKANLFIFYFSGHGIATPKGDFLLPSDASVDRMEEMGVPVKEVIERIVKAGLRNVLFITDACRSGSANDFGAKFYELCREANLAVILGCAPGQRSYEYPRLKSGAFTHFLIESLADPSLRDESGTLWASKLGQAVQKRVHDYTEPDYGKFAQSPTLWGEQSTLDVLLGTYPQSPVSDLAVDSFKKNAAKLDKGEFAAAMTEYAAQLQLADRFDKCVEVLKAVDQLGELTPIGRFLLGSSLNLLGRTGEGSRVFDTFLKEPASYYKDLSLISTKSRTVPPQLRVEAATRILESDTGWTDKMLALQVVNGCGAYDEKLQVARKFAALKTDPRKALFGRGCLAEAEGRWQDAIRAFDQAMKTPGDLPKNREILLTELTSVAALDDISALSSWAERSLKTEGCQLLGYLEKAYVAKLNQDQETKVACLRKVLAAEPDPEDLWRAATVAGSEIKLLKEEFRRAAERHPYSWRARILVGFMKQINGDPKAMDELFASALYREDTLTFQSELFRLINTLLEEGVRRGGVKEMDYRRQVEVSFLSLLGSVSSFGYDGDLWGQFASYGLLNERSTQVQYVLSKQIPFPPGSLPIAVRPLFLLSAMNMGNDAAVQKLNAGGYEPVEGDDERWFYAAYLASKGRDKEALALMAKLRRASPDLQLRMNALKTYLLAKTGRASEARARLKSALDDLVIRGYNGLAWAALGDWKKAEPLLLEQVNSRNWAFLFTSAQAMRVLEQRYRRTGRDTRKLALVVAGSQPSNPLFKDFSFVKKPGVAQFAGKVEMECVIEDDVLCLKSLTEEGQKTYGFGKLTLAISPKGILSGAFTDEQKHKYPFAGQIDALGNLTGQADFAGRKFRVAAKIAPPQLYKSYPGFKEMGQVIEFVDTQGYRVLVIGRPQK